MEPVELYLEKQDYEQKVISMYVHCNYTDQVRKQVIQQLKTELKKTHYYAKVENSFPFEIDIAFTKRKKITITIYAERFTVWKIQGFYTIENDVTLNFEKEELEFTTQLEAIQNPAEQAKYMVSQIMNYISMIYNVEIKNY